MGILGNEVADAAEKVKTLEDHEKWMSGGSLE